MTARHTSFRICCLAGALLAAVALLVYGWSGWFAKSPDQPISRPIETDPYEYTAAPGPPFFRDMTAGSSLDFTHRNGEEADQYTILETLGGGVALIDFDGDGLLDVFVTGGGYFTGPDRKQIAGYPNRLFKNLGGWKFRDVTHEVGLDQPVFYSHGCAVADYDCDGWPDLVVTGWGRLALYHNEPDGAGGRRFRDVTAAAGLPALPWTTSAAWADLDGDGFSDLFLCQYVNWSWSNNPSCPAADDETHRDVCPPRAFKGLPDKLFKNLGDGTFRDVSDAAGILRGTDNDGKGLGVLVLDADGDGLLDICVANDEVPNFLYLNRGRLRFQEKGLAAGVALDNRGRPNGNMGIAAADFDGHGRPSIFISTFLDEQHALFRNLGDGLFKYWTEQAGLLELPPIYVGWGTGFVDVDADGWEDLVIVHGNVRRHPAPIAGKKRIAQHAALLHNQGDGRFVNATAQGGPYFLSPHKGRGLAIGDLDNDGWPDLVISHVNEPVALLRNERTEGRHWLGVDLAAKNHRDLTGAKVTLRVGSRVLTRFVTGGGSYLSANDRRILFGLGTAEKVGRLTVSWPSGEPRHQHWDALAVDHYYRLTQGEAAPTATRNKLAP